MSISRCHCHCVPVLVLLLVIAQSYTALADDGEIVKRTVLGLYDGDKTSDPRSTNIHRLAQMPLNYLGVNVEYWDIRQGLPELAKYPDLRAVMTWFEALQMDDPAQYYRWAAGAIDVGLRMVILGDPGPVAKIHNGEVALSDVNQLLERLGLESKGRYIDVTYKTKVSYKDPHITNYERTLDTVIPPFDHYETLKKRAKAHLIVNFGDDNKLESHLIVTGPKGGVAQHGYIYRSSPRGMAGQWILNPFEFFRQALATDEIPKLDPTTVSNRRVFYSHIDGNGWSRRTEITPYAKGGSLASELILEQIIETYSDLPVSVAPIAQNLDRESAAKDAAIATAHKMFSLKHVDAASHGYSDSRTRGAGELSEMSSETHVADQGAAISGDVRSLWGRLVGDETVQTKAATRVGPIPVTKPTSTHIDTEVGRSIEVLNTLLPTDKRVTMFQWPSTTRLGGNVLAHAREYGTRNIHGGFPITSTALFYATVAPFGIQIGAHNQTYVGNGREHGMLSLSVGERALKRRLRWTESPRRLQAHSVYYNMSAGRTEFSLNHVRKALDFARTQELAPIATSVYAAMVEGFSSAKIFRVGERQWRIEERGALQTLRVDRASFLSVDFAKSVGVLGQRHYQGSLYLALDASAEVVTVALRDQQSAGLEPSASRPYLVNSRWRVQDYRDSQTQFGFAAQGYGHGEMKWRVGDPGTYFVSVSGEQKARWYKAVLADTNGLINFSIDVDASQLLKVQVSKPTKEQAIDK